MLRFASIVTSLWLNRRNCDSDARRAARTAVEHLRPAVVVTGGSRGIGRAIAHEFLNNGHTVLIVARDLDPLNAVLNDLAATTRDRCLMLSLDITDTDAAQKIDQHLLINGCYLDILVNNAATGLSGPFTEHRSADIHHLITLNMAALTHLTHHAMRPMLARGRGGVLNVASLGGVIPGPYQAAYYASKAYVLSLSEALASETSGSGVRLTVIAPGPISTAFHANMGAETARYRSLLPELSPERVAASAHRAFTLGQRVVVPGIMYRLFFIALRVLPHAITVRLTGWLLKNS